MVKAEKATVVTTEWGETYPSATKTHHETAIGCYTVSSNLSTSLPFIRFWFTYFHAYPRDCVFLKSICLSLAAFHAHCLPLCSTILLKQDYLIFADRWLAHINLKSGQGATLGTNWLRETWAFTGNNRLQWVSDEVGCCLWKSMALTSS